MNLLKVDTTPTQDQFDECSNLSPSTSDLDLSYPAFTAVETCSTAPVSNFPGDTHWRTTEYDDKDWKHLLQAVTACASPPRNCLEMYQQDQNTANGMYTFTAEDGSSYEVYCDIAGGGWTRIFEAAFTQSSDRDQKITFDDGGCPCPANSRLNNGANAITSGGWLIGVLGCQVSNNLRETIGGAQAKFAGRINFNIPDYGPATAVRHTGTHHNDNGFDYKSLPGATAVSDGSFLVKNGNYGSAYMDEHGQWQWMGNYGLGTFDIEKSAAVNHPYFTFLWDDGGPSNCQETNADGFDIKDYAIYAKLAGKPPSAP